MRPLTQVLNVLKCLSFKKKKEESFLPTSSEPLDIRLIDETQVRHCDVRYAVFYATNAGGQVTLTRLILTTGESFFSRFPQFQGKVLNKKLQIPLPVDFFDG